ncbi:B3 domain-containing protein At2g33720-like [Macadamia integrifolia]|uniref:B3 domain-containing protein At2g33720-like n=1 Tax=Macadamia integrifolia TaxID=60698 RepID=UPI001C4FCCA8|nr:B3 domain-containing protein At2g33720-like [Macadamia integrifolia]
MAVRRRQGERERERGAEAEESDLLKLKLYTDPWVVKKKLRESDLSNHLSRVILPRDQVEKHVMPFLNSKERHDVVESGRGLWVSVKDWDTDTYHLLNFMMWKSNRSYKLGHRWIPEFVDRRRLGKDDVIGMFWDGSTRCFYFSVLERSPPPPPDAADEQFIMATTPPPPDPYLCKFASENLHLSQPMPEP